MKVSFSPDSSFLMPFVWGCWCWFRITKHLLRYSFLYPETNSSKDFDEEAKKKKRVKVYELASFFFPFFLIKRHGRLS